MASYTAQIRIKRDGAQVYQESQTFARKQAAQAWVRKREAELDQPGAIERANRKGITIKEMIDQYLVEKEKARPQAKTKCARLFWLASMRVMGIFICPAITLRWNISVVRWVK